MTLFGDRACADIHKVGPKYMTGVLIGERRGQFGTQRPRKESHWKIEADIRAMQLQAMECQRCGSCQRLGKGHGI